ncbi:hypothetical protein F4774DRAFT_381767 [Daldinia eschscholtzii]|nr:hypothetical protein F4774DRAFT_381767 [Daldinia eschscholtzii]
MSSQIRRSSIASEKTLVATPSQRENGLKEKSQESSNYEGRRLSSSVKTIAAHSSLPSKMGKAMEKVKSKLWENDSKFKPRDKQRVRDGYPDTAYMWRSLAETKL